MDKIWWKKTDGAHKFLAEAADFLNKGRSVIFCLPERVPWLETMRDVLLDLLNEKFAGVREIKIFDAQSIKKAPQKYVMDNFCPNKEGFRPYGDEAYAEFLAESSNSLSEHCIWIQNADDAQTAAWFAFIADYHRFLSKNRGGVFILEADDTFSAQSRAGIEIFSYADKISDYDCFAFNILTAAEFCRENHFMKQYLAELVTQLVGNDVELGSVCLKNCEIFLREPCEVFKKISAAESRSPQPDDDINFAIWLTQLKLIFPLVEIFRRRLIKKYRAYISAALPYLSDSYERIDAPEQVELGTLCHLVSLQHLWFDKPDWDELLSYREVRNDLAHLKILPFDDLQAIFDKNSRRC